ncbi:hypothetical protein [Streptomyces sp. NPDC001851]|uniref:hypothetical protein n=1 Tax=Streptomyces sp. NPDC001851 TaxID=3154529 RepID=UPI0033211881
MPEQDGENLLPSRSEDVFASMNAWSNLPAAHLKVALNFWDAHERRNHEYRMKQEENRNRLDVAGMVCAFVIAAASVGGAIFFGVEHDPWMAGVMLSPSVFVILKLFITRKGDKSDLKAAGSTLNEISQLRGSPPAQ